MISATERKKIAKVILTTRDNSIIEKIKLLIFPELDRNKISIKKYNVELDEAVLQIKKGNYFTQEEADNLLIQWEQKQISK